MEWVSVTSLFISFLPSHHPDDFHFHCFLIHFIPWKCWLIYAIILQCSLRLLTAPYWHVLMPFLALTPITSCLTFTFQQNSVMHSEEWNLIGSGHLFPPGKDWSPAYGWIAIFLKAQPLIQLTVGHMVQMWSFISQGLWVGIFLQEGLWMAGFINLVVTQRLQVKGTQLWMVVAVAGAGEELLFLPWGFSFLFQWFCWNKAGYVKISNLVSQGMKKSLSYIYRFF